MNEDYRYIDCEGERLFAALHHPARSGSRGLVMCHPLGEEKLWSHRVFVSFARHAAAAGITVLRFDFRGEGDSDREFQEADFETRVQDACTAVEFIREARPEIAEVTLLGLRLGGSVAAVAAARRADVSGLVLWDPVLDGAAYMQMVLRLNLMYQMAIHRRVVEDRDALMNRLNRGESVNVEGYELMKPLFAQASAFRMQDVLPRFRGETLIVQIAQGDVPVRPELASLAESSPRCRVVTVQEEPFWKEIKSFCRQSESLTRTTLGNLMPA